MTGRWPANVIISPEMAEVLDGQSGEVGANGDNGQKAKNKFRGVYGDNFQSAPEPPVARDKGGASRFFLNAGYEPWELEWILANGLVPYPGTV